VGPDVIVNVVSEFYSAV